MQVFIYCKITLHVSGVHRTHYREYIKLSLQPLVQVIVSEKQPSSNMAKWPRWRKVVAVPGTCWYRSQYLSNNLPPTQPFGHGGRLLLYQRLQLQFYVLMMGAMDTRNMQGDLAVNKYLHTVACYLILLIQSHDARNHEYKI